MKLHQELNNLYEQQHNEATNRQASQQQTQFQRKPTRVEKNRQIYHE